MADRMFHSVKNTWESASRENMSDVRELTPEFFYLPEFLTNCNALEFGEQSKSPGPDSLWVMTSVFLLSDPTHRPMPDQSGRQIRARPPLGGVT